jgi:outer membrane protein assembly factor BamB
MKLANKKSRLHSIIKEKSIILEKDNENIVLSSRANRQGKWLIDLRTTFMNPEGLEIVVQLFWDKFKHRLPFQVGGLESGSIPLVAAILLEGRKQGYDINGFFVRKERKKRGRQHCTEGKLNSHPIVVVDDLINAGGALNKVVVALNNANKKAREFFAVVDFQSSQGKAYLEENKIIISSIFKLKDFDLTRVVTKRKKMFSKFQASWRFQPLELGRFYVVPKSTPALDSEKIYFGSDASIFWALDQKTGQPVWQFQCGKHNMGKGIFSSPVVHKGKVYFGSYDGNVYCLNAKNGELIWKFSEADWVGSSPALASDLGLLLIGLEHALPGEGGSVVALDLNTGEKVWEYGVSEYLHGSPAYCEEKGVVAIGTNDSIFFLLDAQSGKKLWEFHTKNAIKYRATFDLKRNNVIFGSHDGKIYILDLDNGKEVWSVQTEDVIYSQPLVVGSRAYVGSSDKNLYVLDLAKQKVFKKVRASGRILATPTYLNSKIYFGSTDGRVYEVDKNGEITGKLQLPERITNAITYSPKYRLYYALSYDNQLFSFKKTK